MTVEKLKSMEPLLGSWYVGAKIAEGRSSKVYKAFRVINGEEQQMCIKTVKFPSDMNELSKIIDSGKYKNVDEYLNILENVIRGNMDKMLALKGNANIVSFEDYTVVKENSCFYVIMLMEILTPLSHFLKADSIGPEQVIKIGIDMCKALTSFREKGVIHHNIRPENIYVDSEGNYKLGDFGIYEISSKDSIRITSYTAPETYRKQDEDLNSDIYSLGIVLYKLLNNNRAPFLPDYPAPISLSDRDNAFSKLMRGEMLTSPANADYELAKIIFKACAYNPAQRYAFPTELQKDFEYYLESLNNAPVLSAAEQRRTSQQAKAYRLEDDNDYYFPSAKPSPVKEQVSSRDKDVYRKVFDDEDEIQEDSNKKKSLYIILGLVVVLALIAALFIVHGKNKKENQTTLESTTTAVSTSAVSTTSKATTTTEEATTEETTTEETTTEETTTEETTTEETTTEETTTEETTTEETTTEETTTEETTTEETTTEEATEQESTTVNTEPATEPILVFAQNEAGDMSDDGKTYVDILNYNVKSSLKKGVVTITIKDDLGKNPVVGADAYIHIMLGDISIVPCVTKVDCKDNGNGTYTLTVKSVDKDYFYDTEMYQYYVCLEQGALQSDDAISLPLQVRLD